MNKEIMIGNHKISEDSPTFVIAEMSANHLMDFDRAVAIMQAAKDAGADAIKIRLTPRIPSHWTVMSLLPDHTGNHLGRNHTAQVV